MPQGPAKPFEQDTFCEVTVGLQNGPLYCYVVMVRMSVNELIPDSWSQWQPDWQQPSHFRRREDAHERRIKREADESTKIALGILEYKVEPKYLGFVPDKDEAWIA